MTRSADELMLTARTCRWAPCDRLLSVDGRQRFCSDSHKVAGHREARRLEKLLRDLDADSDLRAAVVAGRSPRAAVARLAAVKARVQERLFDLRPRPQLQEEPELAELCSAIVAGWPDTEVAKLVAVALAKPDLYLCVESEARHN